MTWGLASWSPPAAASARGSKAILLALRSRSCLRRCRFISSARISSGSRGFRPSLAIAQIGVHLIFFLHITTAPDNTNTVLALAFGVLIVALIIGGSLWAIGRDWTAAAAAGLLWVEPGPRE